MADEGLYFFEKIAEGMVRGIRVDEVYYQGKTKYQLVQIIYSQLFGKVLFLDEKIQSAQIDEHIYHESLVHPALITHPAPGNILIIGGGEGATLREVLRHQIVQKATMVDIDEELVKLCQEYLPEWSDGAFSNPKANLFFEDARAFIERQREEYDVIISDLTEPLQEGPSVYLFTEEFFRKIHRALKKDGLFVLQAGSTDPFYHEFFASCARTLEKVFPLVNPYWCFVFSFASPWGFVLASKKDDPLALTEDDITQRIKERRVKGLKFFNPSSHRGYFILPPYLTKAVKKGKVLTDKNPYIWKL